MRRPSGRWLPYLSDSELSARLTAAKATPGRAWLADVSGHPAAAETLTALGFAVRAGPAGAAFRPAARCHRLDNRAVSPVDGIVAGYFPRWSFVSGQRA